MRHDTLTPDELLLCYPVLSCLNREDLVALANPQSVMRIPAGTTIFTENQPCAGFPLLLSGSIKVIKSTAQGREMLLYRVEPSGSCIISSSCLLGHSRYSARGIAESEIALLILPKALFDTLMASSTSFRNFVFHLFAERIADLMGLVEEVAFSRLDQRLAKALVSRSSNTLQITHQQLAEELGSVREIVSRLLKGFSSQGFVSLGREQIVLLDRVGLEQLANINR
jgi:CRP/FNR family transcriptional regulator, anaerobic regulatory protein